MDILTIAAFTGILLMNGYLIGQVAHILHQQDDIEEILANMTPENRKKVENIFSRNHPNIKQTTYVDIPPMSKKPHEYELIIKGLDNTIDDLKMKHALAEAKNEVLEGSVSVLDAQLRKSIEELETAREDSKDKEAHNEELAKLAAEYFVKSYNEGIAGDLELLSLPKDVYNIVEKEIDNDGES